MVPGEIVVCSGGLLVAQRGAQLGTQDPALRVGDVRRISLPDSAPAEVRRSDNVVWRRHWLEDDRLVIDFVDVATVEVSSSSGTVVFDRRLPSEMEQHLLFDHILPLVLARDGALVLHGGVISRDGKGVVLVGASGAGKSTLTAFAWQRGWTVGGDDGAVLFPTKPPTVEPTYTTVRLTPASADLLGFGAEETSAVAGKMRLHGKGSMGFRQDRVELGLIVIIEPVPSDAVARFQRLAPMDAHARLFGSTFHAQLSGTRFLSSVVHTLASVVEETTVGKLSVPRGLEGLVAAERVLRSVFDPDGGSPGLTPHTLGIEHAEDSFSA